MHPVHESALAATTGSHHRTREAADNRAVPPSRWPLISLPPLVAGALFGWWAPTLAGFCHGLDRCSATGAHTQLTDPRDGRALHLLGCYHPPPMQHQHRHPQPRHAPHGPARRRSARRAVTAPAAEVDSSGFVQSTARSGTPMHPGVWRLNLPCLPRLREGTGCATLRQAHRRLVGGRRAAVTDSSEDAADRIMRWAQFFFPGQQSPDRHSLSRTGGRGAEEFYRERWRHDRVVRSTHGVNCTGSCSWQVFVKDGIITWETQHTDYPSVGPDSPEYEPRGCPRGASFSW